MTDTNDITEISKPDSPFDYTFLTHMSGVLIDDAQKADELSVQFGSEEIAGIGANSVIAATIASRMASLIVAVAEIESQIAPHNAGAALALRSALIDAKRGWGRGA